MKSKLLALVIFCGLTSPSFTQEIFDADASLNELTAEKGNIGVGAAYSVSGKIEWSNSAGYTCLDTETPFSVTTPTRIASISKSMTAVAVMQLADQKLLDLDVPIQTYLSDFPKKEKGDITIRQLLSHTSGIPQYQDDKEIENTIHYASLQDGMNVFSERPLLFKPGSQYYYTTYGYVILGRIIEVVSGTSFENYMQENVWDVAGMKHTGIEEFGIEYDTKACLYHKSKRKTKAGNQNDLSNRVPGGGFYSTVADILKFGEALLDGKLVSDSTFQEMRQSQNVKYEGNMYGLGWYFYAPAPNENLVIGHSGGQTGCTSQLFIVPKTKTVVVVLSNTSGTYPDIVTFASNLIARSEAIDE